MKLFAVLVTVMAGVLSALAQPTITFIDPVPPANLVRTMGQRCPGELCLDDCVFALSNLTATVKFSVPAHVLGRLSHASSRLLDANGQEIASQPFLFLSGQTDTNKVSWSGTKAVACGGEETLTLQVVGYAAYTNTAPPDIRGRTNSLKFKLVCRPCEEVTRTESGGTTTVPHSLDDRPVRLGAMVLNTGPLEHELSITAISANGWVVLMETPSLTLSGGASAEIFLEAIVPGGTPDGVVEPFTVQAEVPGMPGTQGAATLLVAVDTPLSLRLASFHPVTGSVLHVSGPWGRAVRVEVSENLTKWELFHEGPLPPGLEYLALPDGVTPENGGRFYRARLVESPGAARHKH